MQLGIQTPCGSLTSFLVVMDSMKTSELTLISGAELAKLHGYPAVTSQCRAWWKSLGILPLPGRKNIYDPMQVRLCLDKAMGLPNSRNPEQAATLSLVEQRKARKNAVR